MVLHLSALTRTLPCLRDSLRRWRILRRLAARLRIFPFPRCWWAFMCCSVRTYTTASTFTERVFCHRRRVCCKHVMILLGPLQVLPIPPSMPRSSLPESDCVAGMSSVSLLAAIVSRGRAMTRTSLRRKNLALSRVLTPVPRSQGLSISRLSEPSREQQRTLSQCQVIVRFLTTTHRPKELVFVTIDYEPWELGAKLTPLLCWPIFRVGPDRTIKSEVRLGQG